jgi:hypothetical protein
MQHPINVRKKSKVWVGCLEALSVCLVKASGLWVCEFLYVALQQCIAEMGAFFKCEALISAGCYGRFM